MLRGWVGGWAGANGGGVDDNEMPRGETPGLVQWMVWGMGGWNGRRFCGLSVLPVFVPVGVPLGTNPNAAAAGFIPVASSCCLANSLSISNSSGEAAPLTMSG